MAAKAASVDAILTYKLGTWDGGAAEFPSGAGTALQCLITDFTADPKVAYLPTTALCDANQVGQPGLGTGTVTFNAMVPIGGTVFEAGAAILFTMKTDTSVSVAKTYAGLITSAPITMTVGSIQTQAVTVEVGINYVVAS